MNYIPIGTDYRAMFMACMANKAVFSDAETQQFVDYLTKHGVDYELALSYTSRLTYHDLEEIVRDKAFNG